MRQQQHPRVGDQARVHGGLVLEDVEADAGDCVGGEGGDEGGFVDDGAARRVDEGGGGFHERELRGGEEVVGRVLRGGEGVGFG